MFKTFASLLSGHASYKLKPPHHATVFNLTVTSSLSCLNSVFRTFQITSTYVYKTGLQEFNTSSLNKVFLPRFETTRVPSSSTAKGLDVL
jgi:hypothetical protein